MPKAGFNTEKLENVKMFAMLRGLITGKNVSVTNHKDIINNTITKFHLNITNCNGINLLAEAMHFQGETNPVVVMLQAFVTDEEFVLARASSDRMVEPAEMASIPEPTNIHAPEPESAILVPKRTIHDAVREDSEDLDAIIKTGANINEKDGDNRTPIQNAALSGSIKALKTLLDNNADTADLDVAALVAGHDDVIRCLIAKGVYTDQELTYKAAGDNAYKIALGKLLVKLPNGVAIHLCDTGLNALHVATKKQAVESMKTAIDTGISVESTTEEGLTSLQLAVFESKPHSFDILIENNADVFVEEPTSKGNILHIAARVGNEGMANKILALKVAQGLVTGIDSTGANPLHTAASLGHDNIISTIIDHLPTSVNKEDVINARDTQGRSVLSVAADNETTRNLLIEHGAKDVAPVAEVVAASQAPATPEMVRKASVPPSPKTPVQAQKEKSAPPTPASAMKVPLEALQESELSPLTNLIQAVCDNDGNRVTAILGQSDNPRVLLGAKLAMQNTSDVEKSDDLSQGQNILEIAHALSMGNALQAMTKSWLDKSILDLVEAMRTNNSVKVREILKSDTSEALSGAKFAITKADTLNFSGQLVTSSANGLLSIWVSFKDTQNTSTLLHLAAVFGCNADIIGILISHSIDINSQDAYGYTAMHYAVESKNKSVVKSLALHKPDLKIQTAGDKENPSEMAAYLGAKDILEELLGNDMPTYTHLQKAVKSGSDDMFSFIVSKSKQFLGFISVKEKQNILHHIAKDGTAGMVKILDQQSHDMFNRLVPAQDAHKNLPLHLAAARELSIYKAFQPLLSHHETQVVKKKYGGLYSKTVTEVSDLSSVNNDKFQTPDDVHVQYHPDDAREILGE